MQDDAPPPRHGRKFVQREDEQLAVFLGWMAERGWDRTLLHTAAAMTVGTLLMFLFGVGWLAVFLGDLDRALNSGLYPFIAGGVVKIALATLLMPFCWTLLRHFER